ncbi:GAF and ANTAR domain-containing protein [Ornithinimicrobium faecis]|uniref:GAF and ANTAR domain-containing protein n=1 Tax=Ornithinimicrobium faecis TaxID=2934158 RepID=A0ABY4YT80_9MICO|nr:MULTISPECIES: GAF and ANTAR domain-containing protein [unclassified Ornithinimicrobium]USQ79978.1 GAF and ANTAR domain-containing protein [Ornithinimicrobium sp. HY1793]
MNQDERAALYADLSRDLLAQKDEPLTLQRIVELAVQAVPGCDWAGVSLRGDRSVAEAAASTGPVVHQADRLQQELDEGPCHQSSLDNETYIISDTRSDRRWPRWSPRVAELGIRSVLSVQLLDSEDELLGALNLYASQVGAFSRNDLDEALVFAAHAGGAIGVSREVSGLREALRSRHLIGVAQGMLVQRYDLTVDQAFAVLARQSQESNTKLRDVAAHIVEGGRLMGHPEDLVPDGDVPLVSETG